MQDCLRILTCHMLHNPQFVLKKSKVIKDIYITKTIDRQVKLLFKYRKSNLQDRSTPAQSKIFTILKPISCLLSYSITPQYKLPEFHLLIYKNIL